MLYKENLTKWELFFYLIMTSIDLNYCKYIKYFTYNK